MVLKLTVQTAGRFGRKFQIASRNSQKQNVLNKVQWVPEYWRFMPDQPFQTTLTSACIKSFLQIIYIFFEFYFFRHSSNIKTVRSCYRSQSKKFCGPSKVERAIKEFWGFKATLFLTASYASLAVLGTAFRGRRRRRRPHFWKICCISEQLLFFFVCLKNF